MLRRAGLWVAMWLLAAVAQAHHSAAMFDRTKSVELVGTIKEYQFANPHVWIELLVPGAGGPPVQWSIEGEGPGIMAFMGLGPTVLKAGLKITLQAHPLRDGRPGGSFISIKFEDGRVVTTMKPPQ